MERNEISQKALELAEKLKLRVPWVKIVALKPHDALLADHFAMATQEDSEGKKLWDRVPTREEAIKVNLVGRVIEVALCKFLGIYPDLHVGDFKTRPDLPALGLDVRGSMSHKGQFPVYKNDPPERLMVFGSWQTGTDFVAIHGFHETGLLQIEGRWSEVSLIGKPAFWVDSSELRPMDELDEARKHGGLR